MRTRIRRRILLQAAGSVFAAGFLPWRVLSAQEDHTGPSPWDEIARIRERIRPPVFPGRDFVVTEFGARDGGQFLNTRAFEAAISACAAAGGGRVLVPPGQWLSGAIRLRSGVNLHISEDATVLFSQDPGDYLPVVQTWFEGVELMNYSPFIYAFEAQNVAVTGSGTLDGRADFDVWWSWRGPRSWKGAKSGTSTGWKEGMPYQKAGRDRLMDMVARQVPVGERCFGDGYYLRSAMVEFNRCRNVLIEGLTIRNAAFWSVHPALCANVTARGLTIDNPVGANADGVDPECCLDVLIEKCRFDTGDDCISIKSGRNEDGRRLNTPSRNILISDCHFSSERSALSLGSESSGGVNSVFAENISAGTILRLFRIKTNSRRGGVNENIHIRNARVEAALENLVEIEANFSEPLKDDPGESLPQNHFPVIRNISLADISCGSVDRALFLPGTTETPIENLLLRRVNIGSAARTSVYAHLVNPVAEEVYVGGKAFRFS